MLIRDKQELKRCVKQAVRRTQVVETDFRFDVMNGGMGVSELLQTWAEPAGAPNDALRRAVENGTPFVENAAAMFAALSALELPTHNLNNAQTIAESYDRSAYLREVLDVMRARRVLVRASSERIADVLFDDDRFAPMIEIDPVSFFASGRYGVNYETKADEMIRLLSSCGAKDLYAGYADADTLHYALIPVSEDTGSVVYMHAGNSAEDLWLIAGILEDHPNARAVLFCEPEHERLLIDLAQYRPNIMPRISNLDNIGYALRKLNTRFIPYASGAELPELMLGRWENARETIWQALLDAYLPLARAGYELTSEAIAQDVYQLLGGNMDAFYCKIN